MIKLGTQIAYIPDHAEHNINHEDVEFGFAMGMPNKLNMVLCRYWKKGKPGLLRTVANSEMTPVKNIAKCVSVSQYVVDETIVGILETFHGDYGV